MMTARSRARRTLLAVLAATMTAVAGHAAAQAYPVKPVRLVVPFAPGGSTDVFARMVTDRLAPQWPQPIIIENRPGAAANIGTAQVARAPADGYTLLMISPGFASNPSLYKKAGFDPLKDFDAVVYVALTPLVVAVHPSVPAKSLRELVALAKRHPGKLTFASAGSSTHLAVELLKARAGIDMLHVPYKGTAPATTDLLGGHVDLMFNNIRATLPHLDSGRLRGLAVTSPRRSPQAPDIPTVAELGYPGYQAASWFGLVAPAGTPRAAIDRLNKDINAVLKDQSTRERMAAMGAEAGGGTPADFRRFLEEEVKTWSTLIRQIGLPPR